MKKMLAIVVLTAIILSVCAVTALAADSGQFVYTDGNGVCDNTGSRVCAAVDCDSVNCGENFADTNDDGVCDSYGSGYGCAQGCGHGHGGGHHHGRGHGCNG